MPRDDRDDEPDPAWTFDPEAAEQLRRRLMETFAPILEPLNAQSAQAAQSWLSISPPSTLPPETVEAFKDWSKGWMEAFAPTFDPLNAQLAQAAQTWA